MKTSLDCIPCLLRQTLEAARMISPSTSMHEQIIRELLRWIEEMDFNQSPPAMAQRIHRRMRELAGNADPYREAKDRLDQMALTMTETLRNEIVTSKDPLLMAVRYAIAGNVMDMGVTGNLSEENLQYSVHRLFAEPESIEMKSFREELNKADLILYLLDNAGEIAFDKLLIELLLPKRVVAVVRGSPVINDATIHDAHTVGLDKFVQVIDNGSDAPGTILSDCSQEFHRYFDNADMVIAKGQGNFESLSHEKGNFFFLFKVKCPVIADHTKQPLGAHVLLHSRNF